MTRTSVRDAELDHRILSGPTDAPWFVWGHGLTSSMDAEDRFGLIDHDRISSAANVLRYDARGHGGSSSSPDPMTQRWSELAQDQLALVDALDIGRYVAAGASMGCATALEAALAAPDRIDALVLVIPPTGWETRAAQRDQYELTARLVEHGEIDLLLAGSAAVAPPDPLIDAPEWAERFEITLRTTDPDRLARVFRGAAVTDLPAGERIATIAAPTLILAWSGDAVHPVGTAQRLAELLPDARLHLATTRAEFDGWTDHVIEFLDAT